jgi:hypothetical protein
MNENELKSCCSDDCGCQSQNEPRYSGECHADGSVTVSDGLNTTTSVRGIRNNGLNDCDEDCDTESDNSKMHDLVIKQMDYGYLVKAGCQTLCVETQDHLVALFSAYVRDHSRVRTLHAKGKLDTVYVDDAVKKMRETQPQNLYNTRPEINIAVIGYTLDDVKRYLADIVPVVVKSNTGVRKYMLETPDHIIYYYAITSAEHARALSLDKIVETHRARENRDFEKILKTCQPALKHNR